MLLDLILILVAAVFAILAGAALLGAGAFVVASLGRWRKARKAAQHGAVLNLFAEIAHPPIYVGDFSQMGPLPEVLYDPTPTARPYGLGNWVRIGDERVHRSCEQAYPAGLVCSYCLPILLVHARSVTS